VLPLLWVASAIARPALADDTPTKADALAARVVQASGDLYQLNRLTFTFVVESAGQEKLRRTHSRDWSAGTVLVELDGRSVQLQGLHHIDPSLAVADPDAHAEVWSTVAPDVPPATAAHAWSTWINDSYWLLAPAKVLDDGVLRSLDAEGNLVLRFDGVGVTPGDTYALTVDAQTERVTHWTFTLQNGRKGTFAWSEYTAIGPLVLSMHRANAAGDFVIRFADVTLTP